MSKETSNLQPLFDSMSVKLRMQQAIEQGYLNIHEGWLPDGQHISEDEAARLRVQYRIMMQDVLAYISRL